jgi:hypothetical protein
MKAVQMSVLTSCLLLLAGAAHAQTTVTVENTKAYDINGWMYDYWFVEPGAILDHPPHCLGSNQDWGWTQTVTSSVPKGATGIKSARVTIYAWKIDAEDGEDDVIYALPAKPATVSTSVVRQTGTQLGLLKSYNEAQVTIPWSSAGQLVGYENYWSATTFDLPISLVNALWQNGEIYFYIDIDQINIEGCRATLESSVLQVTYFAPAQEHPDDPEDPEDPEDPDDPEDPEDPNEEDPNGTVTPTYVDVYRFWSPLTYSHFYTIGEDEAQMLIDQYAYAWSYEGIAYRALADSSVKGTSPVYRFWSPTKGYHYFTINQTEANSMISSSSSAWNYEGVAFYVYTTGNQPTTAAPVYYFKSSLLNRVFYTIDEAEKQMLIRDYSWIWTYKGIAWYAMKP